MAAIGYAYTEAQFASAFQMNPGSASNKDQFFAVTDASISSSNLTAGHEYLLVAMYNFQYTTTSARGFVGLAHGSTVFDDSVNRIEGPAASVWENCFYWTKWTAVSGEDVELQYGTSSGYSVGQLQYITLIAIDLDDLSSGDFYSSETTSSDAAITFTPGEAGDWLLLGKSHFDVTTASSVVGVSLDRTGEATNTGYALHSRRTKDIDEEFALHATRVYTLGTASNTFTATSTTTGGTRDGSGVFALRLGAFDEVSWDGYTAGSSYEVTDGSVWEEVESLAHAPTATANTWLLATGYRTADADDWFIRWDIDDADILSGWETAALEMDSYYAANARTFTLSSVNSVSSGSRTIDLDLKSDASYKTPQINNVQLIAIPLVLPGVSEPQTLDPSVVQANATVLQPAISSPGVYTVRSAEAYATTPDIYTGPITAEVTIYPDRFARQYIPIAFSEGSDQQDMLWVVAAESSFTDGWSSTQNASDPETGFTWTLPDAASETAYSNIEDADGSTYDILLRFGVVVTHETVDGSCSVDITAAVDGGVPAGMSSSHDTRYLHAGAAHDAWPDANKEYTTRWYPTYIVPNTPLSADSDISLTFSGGHSTTALGSGASGTVYFWGEADTIPGVEVRTRSTHEAWTYERWLNDDHTTEFVIGPEYTPVLTVSDLTGTDLEHYHIWSEWVPALTVGCDAEKSVQCVVKGESGRTAYIRIVRIVDGVPQTGTAYDVQTDQQCDGARQMLSATCPVYTGGGHTTGFRVYLGARNDNRLKAGDVFKFAAIREDPMVWGVKPHGICYADPWVVYPSHSYGGTGQIASMALTRVKDDWSVVESMLPLPPGVTDPYELTDHATFASVGDIIGVNGHVYPVGTFTGTPTGTYLYEFDPNGPWTGVPDRYLQLSPSDYGGSSAVIHNGDRYLYIFPDGTHSCNRFWKVDLDTWSVVESCHLSSGSYVSGNQYPYNDNVLSCFANANGAWGIGSDAGTPNVAATCGTNINYWDDVATTAATGTRSWNIQQLENVGSAYTHSALEKYAVTGSSGAARITDATGTHGIAPSGSWLHFQVNGGNDGTTNPTRPQDVNVAELLVFDGALSSADQDNLFAYLRTKYDAASHFSLLSYPWYFDVVDPVPDPAEWEPTDVANLLAWYDVADISGVSGDRIGTWSDKSGNGYDLTQSTTAKQPRLLVDSETITRGLGQYPIKTFLDSNVLCFRQDEFMRSTALPSALTVFDEFTIVMVARRDSFAHKGGSGDGYDPERIFIGDSPWTDRHCHAASYDPVKRLAYVNTAAGPVPVGNFPKPHGSERGTPWIVWDLDNIDRLDAISPIVWWDTISIATDDQAQDLEYVYVVPEPTGDLYEQGDGAGCMATAKTLTDTYLLPPMHSTDTVDTNAYWSGVIWAKYNSGDLKKYLAATKTSQYHYFVDLELTPPTLWEVTNDPNRYTVLAAKQAQVLPVAGTWNEVALDSSGRWHSSQWSWGGYGDYGIVRYDVPSFTDCEHYVLVFSQLLDAPVVEAWAVAQNADAWSPFAFWAQPVVATADAQGVSLDSSAYLATGFADANAEAVTPTLEPGGVYLRPPTMRAYGYASGTTMVPGAVAIDPTTVEALALAIDQYLTPGGAELLPTGVYANASVEIAGIIPGASVIVPVSALAHAFVGDIDYTSGFYYAAGNVSATATTDDIVLVPGAVLLTPDGNSANAIVPDMGFAAGTIFLRPGNIESLAQALDIILKISGNTYDPGIITALGHTDDPNVQPGAMKLTQNVITALAHALDADIKFKATVSDTPEGRRISVCGPPRTATACGGRSVTPESEDRSRNG